MCLEHVGTVLKNALSILHIPLLGCKSRVYNRLKGFLQLLRLLQLLCQMPGVFGIAFEDLNAVLQRTLGELHIPLLDRSCTVDNCLVRLLNGCCQTLCRLIYCIFRHCFFPSLSCNELHLLTLRYVTHSHARACSQWRCFFRGRGEESCSCYTVFLLLPCALCSARKTSRAGLRLTVCPRSFLVEHLVLGMVFYCWLPGLPPSVLPQRMREYSLCEASSRSWPLPSPLSVFPALSRMKKSGAKKKRREVSTETFSSVADASDASDASGCSLGRSCRICVVRRVRCA